MISHRGQQKLYPPQSPIFVWWMRLYCHYFQLNRCKQKASYSLNQILLFVFFLQWHSYHCLQNDQIQKVRAMTQFAGYQQKSDPYLWKNDSIASTEIPKLEQRGEWHLILHLFP